MHPHQDFDAEVKLTLHRDEAIVLYWFLSREFLSNDGERLKPAFDHPSEEHSLLGVLHELMPALVDTSDPEHADQIHSDARTHLMKRFE
jgi:hypothetical protein